MKVSIFTLEYPPNVYGGVGVHIKSIVKHLSKYVDVEIRTLNANRNSDVKEYESWNIFDGKYPWDKVLSTLSLNLSMVREPVDADIIHTHTWYTNLAGFMAKKLHDKKMVATVHSLEPLRPWKREQIGNGYELSMWMEKTGLQNADGIIAVSQGMKNDIMKFYGIEDEKIKVIYNGIDVEKFKKTEKRDALDELGIEDNYVLFVGRMTKQKGIDTLIEASKHIDGKIVIVTGKEDSKETYEHYRHLLMGAENIIWYHRYFSMAQLVQLYSHAAVFVTPSIYEPFGIINLEAMACETPVVGSAVGGIKEIVQDGINGFLVEPNNAKELADKVNLLLRDKELRMRMGKNGRKRAEEFSWDRIAKETYEFYRRILNE